MKPEDSLMGESLKFKESRTIHMTFELPGAWGTRLKKRPWSASKFLLWVICISCSPTCLAQTDSGQATPQNNPQLSRSETASFLERAIPQSAFLESADHTATSKVTTVSIDGCKLSFTQIDQTSSPQAETRFPWRILLRKQYIIDLGLLDSKGILVMPGAAENANGFTLLVPAIGRKNQIQLEVHKESSGIAATGISDSTKLTNSFAFSFERNDDAQRIATALTGLIDLCRVAAR